MIHITELAPPNSVILVKDIDIGNIPESMNNLPVVAIDSCIAVGTDYEVDGNTTVALTDTISDIPMDLVIMHDGTLNTPNMKLSVVTIDDAIIMVMKVLTTRTRVRIWTDGTHTPNIIYIVVG